MGTKRTVSTRDGSDCSQENDRPTKITAKSSSQSQDTIPKDDRITDHHIGREKGTHDSLDALSNKISESDDDDDIEASTNNQFMKIEQKIKKADLSKRDRRLLQNRKSALKCRLKKQSELDTMKIKVDKLAHENRELKEKVS